MFGRVQWLISQCLTRLFQGVEFPSSTPSTFRTSQFCELPCRTSGIFRKQVIHELCTHTALNFVSIHSIFTQIIHSSKAMATTSLTWLATCTNEHIMKVKQKCKWLPCFCFKLCTVYNRYIIAKRLGYAPIQVPTVSFKTIISRSSRVSNLTVFNRPISSGMLSSVMAYDIDGEERIIHPRKTYTDLTVRSFSSHVLKWFNGLELEFRFWKELIVWVLVNNLWVFFTVMKEENKWWLFCVADYFFCKIWSPQIKDQYSFLENNYNNNNEDISWWWIHLVSD